MPDWLSSLKYMVDHKYQLKVKKKNYDNYLDVIQKRPIVLSENINSIPNSICSCKSTSG